MIQSFLTETTFAGNQIWRFIAFFVSVLLSLILGKIARSYMEKAEENPLLRKKKTVRRLVKCLARPAVLAAFTIGFIMGTSALLLSPPLSTAVATVKRILTVLAIGYSVYSLIDLLDCYLEDLSLRTESRLDDMLFPLVGKSLRITIMLVVGLQTIQALSDKPVTSIIAGLGVGGLAVALAGQDTVRNFFGSLVIIFDKPFAIGDRIVVDGHDGPIESVGFRSTKIRTLEGHVVTIPNGELVNKTVQNIGKRPYIKRTANITVTYDTPPEKVQKAIQIIKDILKNHEGMNEEYPPRVFFNAFNDWSLNIMMIYWYFPPDYWEYMAFSEKVNAEILRQFNAEHIDFAFPTQTIHMENATDAHHQA